MSARLLASIFGAMSAIHPVSAHAQYIPPWFIVAALSPILVFVLCIVLGCVTRSVRVGALHAAFVLTWIVLFSLASYFVENDYVIWTPVLLYVMHSALMLVMIVVELAKRIAG